MENNLICRQLKDGEEISLQNLQRLSVLIYDTDPYIYPCVFNSREDAEALLPKIFQTGSDAMFRLSNCFVAEQDGGIIGLILWHKGPLFWESHTLTSQSQIAGLTLSPLLSKAASEYFGSYQDLPSHTVSLINVCVDAQYRSHGIGRRMLQAFLSAHAGEAMELFVLDDNTAAKKVYASNGFRAVRLLQGFSSDDKDLPCLQMERP